MKDEKILKQLNYYADSLVKDEDILKGAYAEMRSTAFALRVKANSKRKSVFSRQLTAVFAVVMTVFIGIMALVHVFGRDFGNFGDSSFNNGNDKSPITMSSYSFTDLARRSANEAELALLDDVKLLTVQLEGTAIYEAFIYYDKTDNTIYTVAIKYKAIRNGSIEEVIIISDLLGGLNEYDVPSVDDATIYVEADRYVDGEYYTNIYFKQDGKAYFVFIQSPITNASSTYINIF